MTKYLISTVETYRVSSEEEAKQLIEETKNNSKGSLTKYTTVYRDQKAKGEVIDYWYKVTLTQNFNNEKEPEDEIEVSYEKESAF